MQYVGEFTYQISFSDGQLEIFFFDLRSTTQITLKKK